MDIAISKEILCAVDLPLRKIETDQREREHISDDDRYIEGSKLDIAAIVRACLVPRINKTSYSSGSGQKGLSPLSRESTPGPWNHGARNIFAPPGPSFILSCGFTNDPSVLSP